MSADNWDICPACMRRAEALQEAKRAEAEAAYGKVPREEWQALYDEAQHELDRESFRTFREDYEFYGAEDGKVVAVYKGHCTVCTTGLEFRHEHPIELKDVLRPPLGRS